MIVSKSPKIGHSAFDELLAAHKLWSHWLGKGAFASSRWLRRKPAWS